MRVSSCCLVSPESSSPSPSPRKWRRGTFKQLGEPALAIEPMEVHVLLCFACKRLPRFLQNQSDGDELVSDCRRSAPTSAEGKVRRCCCEKLRFAALSKNRERCITICRLKKASGFSLCTYRSLNLRSLPRVPFRI